MKARRRNNLGTLAIFLLLWAGVRLVSFGQMAYFNEWYRPQQSYIKITLAADGLYRVHQSDLQAAGIANLGTLNASTIQLFYRGQEVPVYAQDSLSGHLDYFDFVGRRNDGQIDSLLYRDAEGNFGHAPWLQTNRFSSLFTDTSAYFLTWDAINTMHLNDISTTNFGGYLPQDHFRQRSLTEYYDDPFVGGGGSDNIFYVLNPDYVIGEGWVSLPFSPTNGLGDRQRILATPGFANTGNPSRIEARVIGINEAPNHVFTLDINQVAQYRDTSAGINVGNFGFDYLAPLTATTAFGMRAYGINTVTVDFQVVAWATISYDRKFDLGGDSTAIFREWNHSDTSYVRIYNSTFGSQAWIIDETRQERIAATVVGDTLKFLVPGDARLRDLHFYTDKAIMSPLAYAQPSLHNISDTASGAEFVIVTHRNFAASAAAYAAYRSTSTVNPLSAKVVYVDEIYDEFGYGSFTPWAIKNFCRYALDNWSVRPKHFMLWGKGRNAYRLPSDISYNFVPVFGTPANDWEYVTNMTYDSVNVVPAAGMGRVSLYFDQQGMDYLDKVRDYETQPYNANYKKALFMGGGRSVSEQSSIANANVEKMMPYVEGDPMSGYGFYHQKWHNGDSTNTQFSSEQLINRGLGVLEYFGHSAVNIFELDVLDPNRYTNFHQYPFMIAFGCSGGNFNELAQSYGERMILEPQRGAIAYLGNTTSGFLLSLPAYGQSLFKAMMQDKYGASLGDIFKATIADYVHDRNDVFAYNHAKQLDLQGDPSIRLKFPTQPDLQISGPDIYFPDGNPQATSSSFKMNVILHNEGRSFTDTFAVNIQQLLPSGQIHYHDTIFHRPFANIDTLVVVLQNPYGLNSAGTNQFTVTVDTRDSIQEILESNNRAVSDELFLGNLATPLIPAEYAIVGEQTLFLQASLLLMNLGSPIHYSFEIDTISSFESLFKKSSPSVMGTAALGEWPIGFNLSPGQVYYWRTRLTDYYPEQWIGSSFRYLPGKTGWSQSQTAQMAKNQTDGLELNQLNRSWQFGPIHATLHALIQWTGKAVYFLGAYASQGEAPDGVFCTPIDQHTLAPLVRATTSGDWRFITAPSLSSTGSLVTLEQMIANMAIGDYFLMASSSDPRMQYWPDHTIQMLEQVGANFSILRGMQNGQRILMLGRKGSPAGSAIVITQPNLNPPGQNSSYDILSVLNGTGTEGIVRSTIVGPSNDWMQLIAQWNSLDAFPSDSLQLSVYGISRNGSENLLITNANQPQQSLAGIDARAYPRLRLHARMKDDVRYSCPQLRQWEVYAASAPDLAIDASLGIEIPDSIEEGQRLHLRAFLRNITSVQSDSVWVRFALQNADRSLIELGRSHYPGFAAKELKQISLDANTAALGLVSGDVTLIIEVNPENEMTEQYHFNNFYYHPLHIHTDKLGPLVDVIIDGKHLMEADIVSSEPEITILINDENPYLPVSVSDSTFHIWFGTERSYRTNPMVTIDRNDSIEKSPVRMPENRTRLVFRPGKLSNGEYTLAVQGFDLKGNSAGIRPYVIQMNVVNEKSISQVLPYPNPFSTACHFAYTLTGDEKPSRFEIEIFTITGKLVKVVDLAALGDVHFGHNITAYAWDGRDEFGDQLANGVYIYKVNTKFINQDEVKVRDEGISIYFQNGFGKMYLMR